MGSNRLRLLLVSMMAVFAFSAVAASTASAKRVWTVEGGTLPTGEPKELKVVKVVKNFVLKAGGEEIECTTVEESEGEIENILVNTNGPTGRDRGTIEFNGCKNKNKAACTVETPIEVKGHQTALVENTGKTKIYDLFTPRKWKEAEPEKSLIFATIKQTGTGCVASTKVEGDGVAAEIEPEGESKTKVLKFPCPTPISEVINWAGATVKLKLNAFGVKAEECGEVEIEIEGGKKFGVK